jgi:hypothetical protein
MAACAIERISPTALKIVLVQLQGFTAAKISGSGLFVFASPGFKRTSKLHHHQFGVH